MENKDENKIKKDKKFSFNFIKKKEKVEKQDTAENKEVTKEKTKKSFFKFGKNKENKDNKEKVKFKEKISLNLRKRWLINGTRAFLLMFILLLAYIALNLGMSVIDLPELDVSKGKVYSLSDASKTAIEKIDQEVKIYVYGFEEKSILVDFLKKYNKVNEKITYEILTEETNYEKVKENNLSSGYTVLIFESGDAKKVVDASTEFSTYDYTLSQYTDTTEQCITNSILSLMVENKPKIYFTEGHQEYTLATELTVLQTYLTNESFETATISLASVPSIPEDCDVLAIMSPAVDFFDLERDIVLDYISKGGKIYFSMDPLPTAIQMPNIATILSQYGVSIQNGQIMEFAENASVSNSPNVFKAQVSSVSDITSDIYSSNGEIWLAYSGRLLFQSQEELENLKVERQDLLASSEESMFFTDLSSDLETASKTAEVGASTIASALTKKIDVQDSEEDLESTLIVSANGLYITEYVIDSLTTYPLSYIGNNKDFAINCLAKLADKEGITIRKEISSQGTYIPTDTQTIIVLILIFTIPLFIIAIGIIIWNYRKKRK